MGCLHKKFSLKDYVLWITAHTSNTSVEFINTVSIFLLGCCKEMFHNRMETV